MPKFIPVLPRLSPGKSRVAAPTQQGWEFRDLSELVNVADALGAELPGKSTSFVIDAIPDVWARALLFDFALREPHHPLHDSAVNGLFGFLTLLALRERKNLNVQVEEVRLLGLSRNTFVDVVQRLLPPTLGMSQRTKWDRAFLFKLDGQTIGMTSPLTLVCPAEGMHLTSLARTPWCFDGFRFKSPDTDLDENDRQSVANWLAWLEGRIAAHDAADLVPANQYQNILVGLFEAFRVKLLKLPADQQRISEPALGVPIPNLSFGIYTYLGAALKAAPIGIDRSMVRVKNLRSGSDAETLLIIDDGIASQWGMDEEQVVIINGYSLKEIRSMRLGSDPTKLGENVYLPAHTRWRRSEDLFAERLALIQDATRAFPGACALRGQDEIADRFGGTPILPLKPELLNYLTAEFVSQNAYFERAGDAGIRCGLRIPLEGDRGLTITQEYGPGMKTGGGREEKLRPIVFEPHGVPVLEVWPDFDSPRWKSYFVFWDSRGGDVFYTKPFGADAQAAFPEMRANGVKEREVFQLPCAPEFILCTVKQKRADGGSTDVEVGVLPLRLEPLREERDSEFYIGVDFGTTNTNVYLRKENGKPEPLRLKSATHSVTSPLQVDREESLYRYFLPPATKDVNQQIVYEESPFLSFFSTRTGAPGDELKPIKHGHILFYNRFHNLSSLGTNRVSTNLKWQDTEKLKLESYLRQICLHAAMEAWRRGARRIHWSYSLPSAFPKHKIEDFRVNWNRIVAWVNDELGIASSEAERQTESVVTAKYFAALDDAKQAFPGVGAAFIDIGGGTSDISIWQNDKLLLQSSIRLSGAQIIIEPLFRQRREILPIFPVEVVPEAERRELMDAQERGVFSARTDALLRSHGDEILKWLVMAPSGSTELKKFVDYIGLGLSGLFFYTGLMFRSLQENQKYSLREAATQNLLPSIHVGGNGSKLLHWVSKGIYSNDAAYNAIFSRMFLEGAGWADRAGLLRILVSDKPKAEAAFGLVVDYKLDASAAFDESVFGSIVSGESYRVEGSDRPPTSVISREDLKSHLQVMELTSLHKFIEVYNSFAIKPGWNMRPIQNESGMAANVLNSVDKWVGQQRQCALNDVELEPLFVVGLKAFLIEFLGGGDNGHA